MAEPDDFELEEEITTVETAPIYDYKAWLEPAAEGEHCTSKGAYCFLCCNIVIDDDEAAEEDEPHRQGADGEDLSELQPESKTGNFESSVSAIKNYITLMVLQGMDAVTIVRGVYSLYNNEVRATVPEFRNPVTGSIVKNPEWSTDTILTHLMNSTDPVWSKVFADACTLMLRRLVLKTSESVVDKSTGRIIPENADALCKFIKHHDAHVKEHIATMCMLGKIPKKAKRRRVAIED